MKGRSKLKVKETGKVMAVHGDHIVFGVVEVARRKVVLGTALKVKNGANVFKGQVLST